MTSYQRRKAARWNRRVTLRERESGQQLVMSFRETINYVIGQYADYYSMSDMAQSINAMIASTSDFSAPLMYIYKGGSIGYTPFPPPSHTLNTPPTG